jgi:hypothetical protein
VSLLDVLEAHRAYAAPQKKPKKQSTTGYYDGFLQGAPAEQTTIEPARNSRERGVPERIDINQFVQPEEPQQGNVPMQALEIVGRAPGFISERPLALANQATGGVLDDIGGFGPIKLFGEVVGNISNLPAAIGNAGATRMWQRGLKAGWSDDTILNLSTETPYSDQVGAAGLLQEGSKQAQTWGEFRREMATRGFTEADYTALESGEKGHFDFGDRALAADPVADMGLRMLSDPFNLIFGVGAAAKIVSGARFAGRVIKAGAMAEKLQAPSIVAEGIVNAAHATGIARQTTWFGLAKYFGTVGRGAGRVPGGLGALELGAKAATAGGKGLKAYQKTAIGLTAGQVVIKASESTPLSGFLEPLYEINDAVWDNQPLSQNMAWSLFSAFHFDPALLSGKAIGATNKTVGKLLGSSVRQDVLKRLSEGEGWGGPATERQVLERLGGDDALNNLITHTVAQGVFERVMRNPAMKAALTHYDSLDEAILSNAKVGEMVRELVVEEFQAGRVKGKDVVRQLERWYGVRSGHESKLDFPWDGRNAVERWVEYGAAVNPVSAIFKERGDIVLGLVDNVMFEDLRNMGTALSISAKGTGNVPVSEIRRWLSRFPALANDPKWERYLARDFDGQTVPLKTLQGAIKRAQKDAPSVRDLTKDLGRRETAVARDELVGAEPTAAQTLVAGTGQVLVSRMRPQIRRRLKMNGRSITDVQTARRDPSVITFEERVGPELAHMGFEVESVSQTIGAWEGSGEPSVQIALPTASLDELRLVAALTGRAGGQDAAALAVSGSRLNELLIDPNGYEAVVVLPTMPGRAALQQIHEVLSAEFPGFTLNDTTGTIHILAPGGNEAELALKLARIGDAIEGFFPQDLVGDTGIRTSVHGAYIEFITQKKGDGDASYAEVLAAARKAGDPRARSQEALRDALAGRGGAPRHAPADVGSNPSVGRDASHDRVTARDSAVAPADRVGLGRASEITEQPGYLYHRTTEDGLVGIALEGLKAHGAEFRQKALTWRDGGTGARTFFHGSRDELVQSLSRPEDMTAPVVRVSSANAGRVRVDRVEGAQYTAKRIDPAHLEVWGADGQWHPLESWYEPALEPEILQAAQEVAPAYRGVTRSEARDKLKTAFALTDDQADDAFMLADARARAWAAVNGGTPEQWWDGRIAAIERGGETGPLNQIARRNAAVQTPDLTGTALRVLIDEPEPPVFAQHDLGGSSELEWIAAGDQEIGIPGGVEGLSSGEFTLWDLWRLKAQHFNPAVLPNEIRIPLYEKLFRSQARGFTDPVDTWNRISFALMSPQNPLVKNEVNQAHLRISSIEDLERIANVGVGVEDRAELGRLLRAEFNGVPGGEMLTADKLGALVLNARRYLEDPEWFLLRDGEDLLQYSERVASVMYGSKMKVANFATMLGDPMAFGRGTIDSRMVARLTREGYIDAELAARLNGQAPSPREISVTSKDVPEHLRDLPWPPSSGKVVSFGGDYALVHDALVRKLADDGIEMSPGAYQWMEWDLERKRFEPHTIVFPGAYRLPKLEQADLGAALLTAKEAGYYRKTDSDSFFMSPVAPGQALFYQAKRRPAPPKRRPERWPTGKRVRNAQPVGVRGLRTLDQQYAEGPVLPEPWRDNPYAQNGKAELVPTEFLAELPRGNRVDEEHIQELMDSLLEEGFREPIPLTYSVSDRMIFRDEGNHRIEAARRLGIQEVPVRFVRTGAVLTREGGVPVRGIDPNEHGYVPGDLSPTDIGVPASLGWTDTSSVMFQTGVVDGGVLGGGPVVRTADDLTELELMALDEWQAGPNANTSVRRGGEPDRTARTLDNLMARVEPTSEPMVLYRGVDAVAADQIRASVGGTYGDLGFIATSRVPEQAFEYSQGLIARVEVPAGSRVLPVDELAPTRLPSQEVLLPRGSQFDVRLDGDTYVLALRDAPDPNYANDGLRLRLQAEIDRLAESREGFLQTARERGPGTEWVEGSDAYFLDVAERLQKDIDHLQAEINDLPGLYAQQGGETILGSTQILDDGQAILRGFEGSDFSTAIHELWHGAIERDLTPEDLAILAEQVGDAESRARAFERYLRDGEAPTDELKGVFARAKAWMMEIYARLRGTPLHGKMNAQVRDVFDRLFQAEGMPPVFDPTPDNLTAGLRALEDRGWKATGAPGDEAELLSELAGLTQDTTLSGESLARAQEVQGQLEATRAAKGEARRGQVVYMAERDAEVAAAFPLHRSLSGLDDVSKAELGALEGFLRDHYPAYTLQKSPNPAILMAGEGDIAARYLRDRTWLGNVLADYGPIGRTTRFMDWLFAPVKNHELGRAARQALMNELIGHGASPKDVDRFLSRLEEEASKNTIGPWELRVFRNGQALTQQAINKIAGGDKQAGVPGVFNEKVIASVGRSNFARVLDRASNRFIRSMDDRARKGGRGRRLARAVGDFYGAYQHTMVGDTTRLVGKTMYPIFRFLADPRWWAMNLLEADMLNGLKYGIGTTRFAGAHKAVPSEATLLHQFGTGVRREAKDIDAALHGEDTGWMYTRRHGGYISKAFDAARPETTLDAIRSLTDDALYADLQDLVRQQDQLDGRAPTSREEIMDEDIVQAIDRALYEYDVKGAKATFLDEVARQNIGPDDTRRLYPFLQKVWERNQATYDSIAQTLTGNPNRSNLERIGNSYWLYWPLSYQVKATKWLVGVMTDRFMGAKTNLAPAAMYAHYLEEHRKRLASDPEYVALFRDHPTAWFMAQMIFPITPGDIGISLNRGVRYAGGELGIWGEYKNADDPITAAGAMLSMGPTYTAELLARVGRELFRQPTQNLYP